MSRSRRKTPIVGISTCRSEQDDKKPWHQQLRRRERAALAIATPEAMGAYLPLLGNDVASKWSMGKDGHRYWAPSEQGADAAIAAGRLGKNPQERAALEKRLRHKWLGK